jgi:Protein of unknown function (DUF2510)
MRVLPARRRRRGAPHASAPGSSFTDGQYQGQSSAAVDEPSGNVTYTGIAPSWLVDPTGRHEKRYWSGSAWTEHVTDGGTPGTDPPPAGADRGPS